MPQEFVEAKRPQGTIMVNPQEIAQQEERKEKKLRAERKIADLVGKYKDSMVRFGPDHYLTIMLGSFVEMICQMKLLNDQLEAIGVAFETMASSFDLMDDTLDMITGIMTSSRQRGPFAALKAKRDARKFAKSIKGRFAQFKAYIETIPQITGTISVTMEAVARSFARSNEKSRKRAEKRNKGGASAAPAGGLSAEARGVLSDLGLEEDTTGGSSSNAGGVNPPPAPGPAGGDNEFGSDVL